MGMDPGTGRAALHHQRGIYLALGGRRGHMRARSLYGGSDT